MHEARATSEAIIRNHAAKAIISNSTQRTEVFTPWNADSSIYERPKKLSGLAYNHSTPPVSYSISADTSVVYAETLVRSVMAPEKPTPSTDPQSCHAE